MSMYLREINCGSHSVFYGMSINPDSRTPKYIRPTVDNPGNIGTDRLKSEVIYTILPFLSKDIFIEEYEISGYPGVILQIWTDRNQEEVYHYHYERRMLWDGSCSQALNDIVAKTYKNNVSRDTVTQANETLRNIDITCGFTPERAVLYTGDGLIMNFSENHGFIVSKNTSPSGQIILDTGNNLTGNDPSLYRAKLTGEPPFYYEETIALIHAPDSLSDNVKDVRIMAGWQLDTTDWRILRSSYGLSELRKLTDPDLNTQHLPGLIRPYFKVETRMGNTGHYSFKVVEKQL